MNFKDIMKSNLRMCDINNNPSENEAADRSNWKKGIAEGFIDFEASRK